MFVGRRGLGAGRGHSIYREREVKTNAAPNAAASTDPIEDVIRQIFAR